MRKRLRLLALVLFGVAAVPLAGIAFGEVLIWAANLDFWAR